MSIALALILLAEAGAAPPASPPPVADAPLVVQLAPAPPVRVQFLAAGPQPAVPPAPSAAAPARPGDIVVTGRAPSKADPLEKANVASYKIVQGVDKAIAGPIALAYKRALPSPIRTGVRNFIYNVREPSVIANFLLQHKVGKAFETAGRLIINTTIGIGGLLDIAKRKPFHLPRRRNGFANTMGFYGIKPGPYLFLPFVGPTTVRDLIGDSLDRFFLPFVVRKPFARVEYVAPTVTLSVLDSRAEFDEDLQKFRAQPDSYLARREFYLQYRQAEIDRLHGRNVKLPTVPAAPPPEPPAPPPEPAAPADGTPPPADATAPR